MLHTICTHTGKIFNKIFLFKNKISKYRILDEKRNVILADCDDDGETGASSRMLHLMDVSRNLKTHVFLIPDSNLKLFSFGIRLRM